MAPAIRRPCDVSPGVVACQAPCAGWLGAWCGAPSGGRAETWSGLYWSARRGYPQTADVALWWSGIGVCQARCGGEDASESGCGLVHVAGHHVEVRPAHEFGDGVGVAVAADPESCRGSVPELVDCPSAVEEAVYAFPEPARRDVAGVVAGPERPALALVGELPECGGHVVGEWDGAGLAALAVHDEVGALVCLDEVFALDLRDLGAAQAVLRGEVDPESFVVVGACERGEVDGIGCGPRVGLLGLHLGQYQGGVVAGAAGRDGPGPERDEGRAAGAAGVACPALCRGVVGEVVSAD